MKRRNKGFTFMEMLIVVAIIGILITIAVPYFLGQLKRAEQVAEMANAKAVYETMAMKLWLGDVVFSSTDGTSKKIIFLNF